MRPDPERARLAAESLARARADAWARGERPGTGGGGFRGPNGPGGGNGLGANGPGGTAAAGSPAMLGGIPGGGSPGSNGGYPGGRPPGRTRRDDPQPLNAAVGGLLSARGWRQQAAVGAVFSGWTPIVGPQLAAHTKPEAFSEGELVVSADSDAWAAQVRLMAPQLLKRLAEELGHGTVLRIRVRGPVSKSRGTGRLRAR